MAYALSLCIISKGDQNKYGKFQLVCRNSTIRLGMRSPLFLHLLTGSLPLFLHLLTGSLAQDTLTFLSLISPSVKGDTS